jgi:hypothetical protein
MTHDRYSIKYAPPLAVRDNPHRELDTARGTQEGVDLKDFRFEDEIVIQEVEATDAVRIIEPHVAQIVIADAG